MASTNILSVSLKDYKKQIDDLKSSMLSLQKGSDEYKKAAQQAKDMQDKLNSVMKDAKTGADAESNSLNALREQLSQMKAEAANLDVGTEKYKEAAVQIDNLNNKIKEAEEAQGNFSRNVGNYTGSMVDAFSQLGVNISGLKGAFAVATTASGTFSAALTALQKHPIAAALAAIVTVLYTIYSKIKDNETAMNKWEQAMSAFQPFLDLLNTALGYLADGLSTAALWIAEKLPKALDVCSKPLGALVRVVGR